MMESEIGMEKVHLNNREFTRDDIYNLILFISEEDPDFYMAIFRKCIYELEVDWAVPDSVIAERVFEYCQEYDGDDGVWDDDVDMLLRTRIPDGYFGDKED